MSQVLQDYKTTYAKDASDTDWSLPTSDYHFLSPAITTLIERVTELNKELFQGQTLLRNFGTLMSRKREEQAKFLATNSGVSKLK